MSIVQSEYSSSHKKGRPGSPVYSNKNQYDYVNGKLTVPTNGGEPQAGMTVYYDNGNKDFRTVTNADQAINAIGIISEVSNNSVSIPTDKNPDTYYLRIGIAGIFWGIPGEVLEFGNLVVWDTNNDGFIKAVISNAHHEVNYPRNPAVVVSFDNSELVEIRFSGFIR